MIDYQTLNNFQATGDFHYEKDSIPVMLSGSYRSNSSDPVEVKIWSEDENSLHIFHNAMHYPSKNTWFEGKTIFGESIFMMGIRPNNMKGFKELSGIVRMFFRGDIETIINANKEYSIVATISPTPLVIPDWTYLTSYNGTISQFGTKKKDRKGIRWESTLGSIELIDTYNHVSPKKQNEDITVRTRVNSLNITNCQEGKTAIKDVLFDLQNNIWEDLNLLSFLSRKRIVCYEAFLYSKNKREDFEAKARYQTWKGFDHYAPDQSIFRVLVSPDTLKQGLFSDLRSNYKKTPYKDVIDRTIRYLITSYEDGYTETHLISAYAALESMVDGIGSHLKINNNLGSKPFKKLSKKIELLISVEIDNQVVAENIIAKIPELRRRTFLDCLLDLLEKQNVCTALIWPPNTDERLEFHNILNRRNQLIHRGELNEGYTPLFDLNRVQKLVELWILKLLDCPDKAIFHDGLWHEAPINEVLHY